MTEGTNKLTRGNDNIYNLPKTFRYLKLGEVMSVDDPNGLGRIKVWIKGSGSDGGDDELIGNNLNKSGADNLPWCHPMLPKHFSIQPKIGETVWVFVFSREKEGVDRLFIGPITSQLDKLPFDSGRTTALAGFSFGPVEPNVNIDDIPLLKGVFPNPKDVSIQGRYNTDITQKDNEILIRAGKFVERPVTNAFENPYPFVFNTATQGYIQIKNNAVITPKNYTPNNDEDVRGTVTNIVSNKINLITHVNGSPRFNVTNQDNLISDDELQNILSKAHQVPFGDVLLEYLILFKEALFAHVHRGNGLPATDLTISGNKQGLKAFKDRAKQLEDAMLSKNIRIN